MIKIPFAVPMPRMVDMTGLFQAAVEFPWPRERLCAGNPVRTGGEDGVKNRDDANFESRGKSMKYILSIDQGTTGTTALILNHNMETVAKGYREFPQHYPQPGWVSHDAEEIWQSVQAAVEQAKNRAAISDSLLEAIGITNQRETTVLWDRKTGQPVAPAIVWQCRRTTDIISQWKADGEEDVTARTGLILDAYFSASKIRWMLDQDPALEARCRKGEIAFGTIDSFLIYRLTGQHCTEPSNASRTLLYNLEGRWDPFLLERFQIPEAILPEVLPSVGRFGVAQARHFGVEIPVMGVAGDQQAALFGQACHQPGQVKSTYGTGCFLMMNSGARPVRSAHRLLTTVAWQIGPKLEYALEGSVFSAGSAVQWLRDGLKLITRADESEALARSVTSSDGVVFVPAFTGLGAPYWDAEARGGLLGVTRGTRREHVVRAVLEAVAFQNRDLVEAMSADVGHRPDVLRVDGGMVANDFLMQFQADLLGVPVDRPRNPESTAYGAACLAALGAGWFSTPAEIAAKRQTERLFEPTQTQSTEPLYRAWKQAVNRVLTS